VGRIGCFLTGLADNTYGTPTGLPWGVDFGDRIHRHPTQLYEIAFLMILIPLLWHLLERTVVFSQAGAKQRRKIMNANEATTVGKLAAMSQNAWSGSGESRHGNDDTPSRFISGDTFIFFVVAYMSFRLLCDLIKPYPRLLFGLGGIQWACLVTLLYYSHDVSRWLVLPSRRS
jgi:prolipoprotein diacylglyceryltransferase